MDVGWDGGSLTIHARIFMCFIFVNMILDVELLVESRRLAQGCEAMRTVSCSGDILRARVT
jgi:hypothetical protein